MLLVVVLRAGEMQGDVVMTILLAPSRWKTKRDDGDDAAASDRRGVMVFVVCVCTVVAVTFVWGFADDSEFWRRRASSSSSSSSAPFSQPPSSSGFFFRRGVAVENPKNGFLAGSGDSVDGRALTNCDRDDG